VTVTPNSTPGDAVDAEVRGRFFIARNVELEDGDSNQLAASTSATTLAGNSPSSSTVLDVALATNVLWTYSYSANGDLALMESTVHDSAIQWSYTYSVDGWLTKAVKLVDGQTTAGPLNVDCYRPDVDASPYANGSVATGHKTVYAQKGIVVRVQVPEEIWAGESRPIYATLNGKYNDGSSKCSHTLWATAWC
jgi:hypothetical protein